MSISVLMPLAQMNSTTAPAHGAPSPEVTSPPLHALAPPGPAVAPATGASPVTGGALAANSTQPGTQPADGLKHDSIFNGFGLPLLILAFIAMYFFMTRGQKKEEKRRKSLLAEMKKGDKVQTIGGLVARIVSIDNDDVVLKVDESANVKAVYKKTAILNVIGPAEEKGK